MPGLAGIIGIDGARKGASLLQPMISCMMHEPFYTSGRYVNEEIGLQLGWVSLKEAFSAEMPVWNEKKDVAVIFCGEDFTDPDEIAGLKNRAHEWGSAQAGYLVHLYEEQGARFLEKLNGRFSGVIVDLRQRRVSLFNDRFGFNRIYYHENPEGLFFSSEAKSLLKVLPELRRVDLKSLAETFSCGCVLQNRTLFAGISQLPGGSVWSRTPGGDIQKGFYFRPGAWIDQEPLGVDEYYGHLKETWTRILPRYLRARTKIGISLTGGKDSRMIMAWARTPPGTLPCYTFGGVYRDSVDVKIARQVAKVCRQPHQVISVGQDYLREFPDLAARTVYISDGAMDVSGSTDLYVNKIARGIAPLRLTGNYGQEILRSAVAFKAGPWPSQVLDEEFARLIGEARQTYGAERGRHPLAFVAFKQVPWHHYSRLIVELSQVTLRSPFLDNDLVALAFRVPRELAENVGLQLRLIAAGNPVISKIGTDRALLYESVPWMTKLEHLYQEFIFKAEYAYDYGMPQWLAKADHWFEPFHLERLFLGRHKFYHFRVWYRDQLSAYVKDILLDSRTRARPYLRGPLLEKMVREHTRGIGNHTSEIHRILTSELMHRRLIEGI